MNRKCAIQILSLLVSVLLLYVAGFSSLFYLNSVIQKDTIVIPEEQSALFPASLQAIGDEAFYGVSINVVVFSERLRSIGREAFTDANHLTDVYIPKYTDYIGINAFPERVLIHGVKGSYSQTWAHENGYVYINDDIWDNDLSLVRVEYRDLFLILLFTIVPADAKYHERMRRRVGRYIKSMCPKDRPELYPINYRFP